MKRIALFILSASLILGLSNCKKEKEELRIFLDSPESGKVYPNSGTLAIKGKITADEVDEVEIEIKNKATGEKVFEFEKHVHTKDEYIIDKTWTWNPDAITEATLFEIHIHATEEHDGEHTELKRSFTIAP
jgi:hypothetical protein